MSPEDVKALRTELRCSAHELARVLDVDASVVFAWENGDLFPTKKHCERMRSLRAAGPEAFPRRHRGRPRSAVAPLRDERFLQVLRKLARHPDFFEKTFELSAAYDDPDEA